MHTFLCEFFIRQHFVASQSMSNIFFRFHVTLLRNRIICLFPISPFEEDNSSKLKGYREQAKKALEIFF